MINEVITNNPAKKFRRGQRVRFNGGYLGTVLGYYSEGMIEVRNESGTCCICESAAEPVELVRH